MAEYGQKIQYAQETPGFGIDEAEGSLSIQDYKPAIRLKKVWDAIFTQFGYRYTGSFWNQEWLDQVYLFCNNGLRAPVYPISIENFGQGKVTNVSGSAIQTLTDNVTTNFLFSAKNYDVSDKFRITPTATTYSTNITTYLTCKLDLAFEVSHSGGAGSGAPLFYLYFKNTNTGVAIAGIVRQASRNPTNLTPPQLILDIAIRSAAVLANIFKARNAINQAKLTSPSSIGGVGGGGAAPVVPSAPLVNTRTQLDSTTIQQLGSATNRAYVVESDVTNSQERIRSTHCKSVR